MVECQRRALLAQSIDRAHAKRNFRVIGFVFVPEHIHLIVFAVSPSAKVAELLYAIKRPLSFRVQQLLHPR